jgi:hypothetical protein
MTQNLITSSVWKVLSITQGLWHSALASKKKKKKRRRGGRRRRKKRREEEEKIRKRPRIIKMR